MSAAKKSKTSGGKIPGLDSVAPAVEAPAVEAPAVASKTTGKGPELIARKEIEGLTGRDPVTKKFSRVHTGEKFYCSDDKERARLLDVGAVQTVQEAREAKLKVLKAEK